MPELAADVAVWIIAAGILAVASALWRLNNTVTILQVELRHLAQEVEALKEVSR